MADHIGHKYVIGDKDFAIQRMQRSGFSAMSRPHSHSCYEIYYLLAGERVYFMNGNVTTVSKSELMFINPNDLHSTASSKAKPEFERILLQFSHEFVRQADEEIASLLPFEKSRRIRLQMREQVIIEQILEKMLLESESQSVHYISCIRSLLIQLLIHLDRARSLDEAAINYAHPMHHKISEIALYMNRNYTKALTLSQISTDFYISPSYLSRLFKRLTGFHFSEYLQVIRIREAQKKLVTTNYSVQLISEQVGFEDISHFNKTFKRLTDTTPLKYRKSHQKN